jgi:hypothetical protein
MRKIPHRIGKRGFLLLLGAVSVTLAWGQTAAPAAPSMVRLRGTIESVTSTGLKIVTRSGEPVELQLAPNLVVNEVYPITLEQIQPGSYIGTAAIPQADGSQKAIAITVFPEAARGTAEGHRPFDLAPQSTMTNATVAQVVTQQSGRTLSVQFKGGDMKILVPEGVPVVTFKPADKSLLVQGASVSITAQLVDDKPTAMRINAGRNGFVLPY